MDMFLNRFFRVSLFYGFFWMPHIEIGADEDKHDAQYDIPRDRLLQHNQSDYWREHGLQEEYDGGVGRTAGMNGLKIEIVSDARYENSQI